MTMTMVADHLCERLAKLYEEGRYRDTVQEVAGLEGSPTLPSPRRGRRARWAGGREHRADA